MVLKIKPKKKRQVYIIQITFLSAQMIADMLTCLLKESKMYWSESNTLKKMIPQLLNFANSWYALRPTIKQKLMKIFQFYKMKRTAIFWGSHCTWKDVPSVLWFKGKIFYIILTIHWVFSTLLLEHLSLSYTNITNGTSKFFSRSKSIHSE